VVTLIKAAPFLGLLIADSMKKGLKFGGTGAEEQQEALAKGERDAKSFLESRGNPGQKRIDEGRAKLKKAAEGFEAAIKKFTSESPSFIEGLAENIRSKIEEPLGGNGGAGVAAPAEKQGVSSLRRIGANMIAGAMPVKIEKEQLDVQKKILKEQAKATAAFKERVDRRGKF